MKRQDQDIDKDLEQRDEEYARRVLREVQYMQREQGAESREGEQQEQQKTEQTEQTEQQESKDSKGKRTNLMWLLLSGNVLLLRGLTKYYGQMAIVAAMFLLSIIVMFWSLHLDMQYNSLVRDVQLLRERSIRFQEVRFSRCSHSAIVEELERRGIDLVDPTTPATVIKEGKKSGF